MRLRRQSGVGMVEVLVAIVIVAFALLGMAGLQVSSLRYQKTAHVRGLAAQYTSDIADRIRANMDGAFAGNYVIGGTLAGGAGAAPGACASAPQCTPAEIATRDIYNWRLDMARGMNGWGDISGGIAAGYVVTVYFREPNKLDYDPTLAPPPCRAAALGAGDGDVRCLQTVVMP